MYNTTKHDTGEIDSLVPGWIVTYPASCNGHVGDIGFVASRGYGGSGFIHFDPATGEPYGIPLTAAARTRVKTMRKDFRRA